MKIREILEQNLINLLEIARYAPSVHNTQPWLVQQIDDQLMVSVDIKHQLSDGDPTGRQTIISLGIFCESLVIAAKTIDLETAAINYHDNQASLSFKLVEHVDDQGTLISLLQKRSSDRSIYKPVAIEPNLLQTLGTCGQATTTTVITSLDSTLIKQVAELTGKAINVALSSPGFRQELSQYLVVQGSRKLRGIAVGSLYINPLIARLQPVMLRRGINIGAEAKLEKQRWLSASGLVIITAPGDIPSYWLEVGRAYLRASLAIQAAGLSQATSAAIVEASNYHEDIETALGTSERILAIIRIGGGSPKRRYSPRVSAQTLLGQTTSI